MKTVRVNGNIREIADEAQLSDVVSSITISERGIAVAVDGVVVPRRQWQELIHDGATIEIVTAVQGG